MTTKKSIKRTNKAAARPARKRTVPTSKTTKKSSKTINPSAHNHGVRPDSPASGGRGLVQGIDNSSTLGANTIRIRMYRVGFGDCFLISLPMAKGSATREEAGHLHILIDCGVHVKGDIGTIGRIVDDIANVTDKKLAVVIATHAHQDHIAGYDRYGDKFSAFEISEVWLPWTWDPNNSSAINLQKKQIALTAQLAQHFEALAAAKPKAVNAKAANAIENLKGNAHAIALLKSGFGVNATVRYLKAGDDLINPAFVQGLSVSILGPPQSEEFLAQMDPPAGQHYLRMGPDGEAEIANIARPFARKWALDSDEARQQHIRLTESEEKQLQNLAGAPLDDLAFALDQARNNESLVTLFIFRGQYLLFPGDAQYGNWRWWLENEQPDDILPRINFFKVAHHGSVNATPKNALEKMTEGKFAAMVSTQSTPWGSIPRVPLMERLDEKTKSRIVRSDWLGVAGAPDPLPKTAPLRPSQMPSGFSQGEFWFDYLIEV